ncbi:HNH endonuclease [Marinobacterium stanieri]|uniref:HNH endonuclease n=1 Tax=Marinobacterium stanieri TaxID=49186 RepID=A0A1N6U6V1_9GAMM|nr:HNH endonuclease [Marinobacterium stanieri]SIQ61388.1 HNH endonuclease [Marinobacterium stanieri]
MNRLKSLRKTAYSKQNKRCYYCNAPMWLGSADGFCDTYSLSKKEAKRLQCTAEHLKARQDGGGDQAANVVAACQFCNSTRHKNQGNAKGPSSYRSHVQRRIKAGHWHPKVLLHKIGLAAEK